MMDYFDLSKKRISFFMWILLAMTGVLAYTQSETRDQIVLSQIPIIAGVILNMGLTIPFIRKMMDQVLFFIVLIGFALITAFLFHNISGTISPYYLFYFPLLAVSLCFAVQETVIMCFVVSILDILVTYFGSHRMQGLISYETVIRIVCYFIAALLITYFREENRKDMLRKEKEIKEIKSNFARLDSSHQKLTGEKAEIEQIKEALKFEKKYSDTLFSISKTLTQTLDLEIILAKMISSIKSLLPFDSSGIFLFKPENKELYCAAVEGCCQEEMKNQAVDASTCMPGIAASRNQPLIVNDVENDPRFTSISASTKMIKSAIYVPISIEEEVYGSLCLWSIIKNAFSDKDLKFLSSISHEAARAIKNAELYKALDTRLNFIVALWNTSKNLASVVKLSSPGRKSVLEKALEIIKVLFDADGVIFYVSQKESGDLLPFIVTGIFVDVDLSEGFDADTQILAETAKDTFNEVSAGDIIVRHNAIEEAHLMDAPIPINSISVSSYKKVFLPLTDASRTSSLYWYPLKGRETTIGALVFLSRAQREWTKEESQWADIFCNLFSMSLENISLVDDIFSEKNQLEVLVNSMPEGVFTTDTERKIITWNNAARSITGWTAAEVTGRDCSAFIKCQTVDKEKCESSCFIRNAVNDEEKKESDIENIYIFTKREERIPVYITAAPIYGERKKVSGSICVFRDITREKEIEKIKEDFLATITHDLKSPLASIMGYSELIGNPKLGELNKTQTEFIQAIQRSCKTLQILVNNILSSTRLEAGQMQYNFYDFNIHELFEEIYEMFVPITQHKKIELVSNVAISIMVRGDREKIKEVITNLISNAIKFTPENGTISLTGEQEGGILQISVKDTGKGIPKEETSRLFQKFAQLKGEKRGTGLGLYIVKKIVEAHGQNVRVESTIGQGSSFSFTLEIREAAALKTVT
ncbi:MAG: ATP-binding protein [Vulcanimicrobiota bacterium]